MQKPTAREELESLIERLGNDRNIERVISKEEILDLIERARIEGFQEGYEAGKNGVKVEMK